MSGFDLKYFPLTGQLADVSTASKYHFYIDRGMEGELIRIKTVLGGAIATADATITVSINGTSVGTVTVATASSAAGDVDSADLSGYFLTEGDYLTVETNGASTNTVPLAFTVRVKR